MACICPMRCDVSMPGPRLRGAEQGDFCSLAAPVTLRGERPDLPMSVRLFWAVQLYPEPTERSANVGHTLSRRRTRGHLPCAMVNCSV